MLVAKVERLDEQGYLANVKNANMTESTATVAACSLLQFLFAATLVKACYLL